MEMFDWIKRYYNDCFILVCTTISYGYLFFKYKEDRKKVLYPVLLIVILLLDPVLYIYIYRANRYWRFFWMIPNCMFISLALVKFIESAKSTVLKVGAGLFFTLLVVLLGTNVFKNGGFERTHNWEKVSPATKEICDFILALDDNPRCIMPGGSIFCETRQYNGDIIQYYGRDAYGYIFAADSTRVSVFKTLESMNPDYDMVLREANNADMEYIVVDNTKAIGEDCLEKYGFEYIGEVDAFLVYGKVR